MPIEFDNDGLRIIGHNVSGVKFYDDDRTLRQELYLNDDNELVISGSVETLTQAGNSAWQTGIGVPVDINKDGITIWTSGKHLNMIRYLFNDAGTSRYQARMYAVYNSAIKAGEFWIRSVRDAGYPWTHCVLNLGAYDYETDKLARLVLTTKYDTPRIECNCDIYMQDALVAPQYLYGPILGNLEGPGGGAVLMLGWLGNSREVHGQAATAGVWTEAGITIANYGVYRYGGPFIMLNGSDEYLTLADAGWNEVGAYNLMAWWWVYTGGGGSDRAIIGKTKGTTEQSWLMYQDAVLGWCFYVNGTGADADKKLVSSNHALTASRWTFVGVFYKPSTSIRIYIGEAAYDTTLTVDENTTSIPASLFNGTADLRLGATSTPAMYWSGGIGGGVVRLGAGGDIVDYVDDYMQDAFNKTKRRYT